LNSNAKNSNGSLKPNCWTNYENCSNDLMIQNLTNLNGCCSNVNYCCGTNYCGSTILSCWNSNDSNLSEKNSNVTMS